MPNKKVFSPYWPKKFNPHHPYGVVKSLARVMHRVETTNVVFKEEISIEEKRNERALLKKLKKECLPFINQKISA